MNLVRSHAWHENHDSHVHQAGSAGLLNSRQQARAVIGLHHLIAHFYIGVWGLDVLLEVSPVQELLQHLQ